MQIQKNNKENIKIGIIGNGKFTDFILPYLQKYFEIFVFGCEKKDQNILQSLDYLILSVPLENLKDVCLEIKDKIEKHTVIIDVTSVKVEPVKILKQYFTNNQILGTHPIFGPQSGKNGIENLPIILTNISLNTSQYTNIKKFLETKLFLKVIEQTPEQHDIEMACIQGLSHFIGKALFIMGIKEFETATKGYNNLIQLKETVGYGSWELYKTIQNGNPLAKNMRQEFLKTLKDLEKKLEEDFKD